MECSSQELMPKSHMQHQPAATTSHFNLLQKLTISTVS